MKREIYLLGVSPSLKTHCYWEALQDIVYVQLPHWINLGISHKRSQCSEALQVFIKTDPEEV